MGATLRSLIGLVAALLLGGIGLLPCAAPARAADEEGTRPIPLAAIDHPGDVDFEQEILPLLRDNCLACHNRTRAKADLILETPADILRGGESGLAVVPGKAGESLLLQAAAHQAKPSMPPKDNKVSATDLSGEQLALLRLWIDQGAKGEVRSHAPLRWVAPAPEVRPIYAVALTPDGRYAAAGRGNRLDVYDVPLARHAQSLTDPALSRTGLYGTGGAAHRGMVESLAFSPDGILLASGSFGEVKLWRRQPTAPPLELTDPSPGKAPDALIVAVAAGGNWAAVARAGLPVDLFDASTGKWTKSVDGSTSPARAIAFSPDGTRLAVASVDGGLRISGVAEGQLIGQTAAPSPVTTLAWLQNGTRLAAAGPDGVIRVYSVPHVRGEPCAIPLELKAHRGAITMLAAPPSGGDLYSGGEDGTVRRWSVAGGQVTREFKQGGPITALAVRPDGKAIASAGPHTPARLWDADKGSVIAEVGVGVAARRELARCQRAGKLAAADVAYFGSMLEKSQAEQKAADERLKAASDAKAPADVKAADARAARDRAAAAKAEAEQPPATVSTTQPVDPQTKARIEAADKALTQANAQLAVAALAASNADNEFRLARHALEESNVELARAKSSLAAAQDRSKAATEAATSAQRLAAEPSAVELAFSGDGTTFIARCDNGTIDLFSADAGLPLETLPTPSRPAVNRIACVGQTLILADDQKVCGMTLGADRWSLERTIGAADGPSPLEDRVTAVAFSPDGRLLATGAGEPSRSGQIKLWDVATGRPAREIKDAHSDAVLSLAFSPDGALLASGAADRFAKVFDAATGQLVHSFEGHSDHVTGVSWKPDRRTLATCGADGQVKFWDVVSGERKANVGGFVKEVDAIAYLGLTDQVVAAAGDGQVRIFNEAGATVRSVPTSGDFFHAVAMTPDGHLMALGGESGVLSLWREPFTSAPLSFRPE
ncbi:MAG TPA: c-type cytochrome domain-containing protein [Tepidisphaeraceae bacterium]